MSAIDAFPLQWPSHWSRTEYPEYSSFSRNHTIGRARDGVIDELRRMGVDPNTIVISTNLELRKDGLPYANRRVPDDPGVAVYFVRDGRQMCIPCDKWNRIQDNLHAIKLTIEALRGVDRWGAKSMMDAMFQGFEALPAQSQHGWWVVLGVERDALKARVRSAYRDAVLAHHPDRGGDPETFYRIQAAYDEFKRERGL